MSVSIQSFLDDMNIAISLATKQISDEEIEKAKERIEQRVIAELPSITAMLIDRVDAVCNEKEIVFKIKPKD